jgi:hypothetical protein
MTKERHPKRFWNYTRHFSKSSSSIAMIEKDGVKQSRSIE